MGGVALHPDQPLWQWGPFLLNATILWTWVRRESVEKGEPGQEETSEKRKRTP